MKQLFLGALRRLLRPVAHQAIAWRISYGRINQMLRELLVEVAEDEFKLPFKRQTDSRLALLTGLPRKEVASLRRRRQSGERIEEPEDSVVTRVVGRWMSGPPFATPDGKPRRLIYDSEDEAEPSFTALVRSLNLDIPVRAVLDDLVGRGGVNLTHDDRIELAKEANVPADTETKLRLLGTDPAELFATIVHNIEEPQRPWLQRKVVYDNVGARALAAIEAEARDLGEEFVRRANALLASYDRDRNAAAPGGDRTRVVLGTYYNEEGAEPSTEDDGAATPTAVPPGRIRRKR